MRTNDQQNGFLHFSLLDEQWSTSVRALITHPMCSGLVLFKENYKDISQLSKWIHEIKQLNPNLLISIDQEGGLVQRLRPRSFLCQPPLGTHTPHTDIIEGYLARNPLHQQQINHAYPRIPVQTFAHDTPETCIWIANPYDAPPHKRWIKTWENLVKVMPKNTLWLTHDRSLLNLDGPSTLHWSSKNPFPLFDEFKAYPSAAHMGRLFEKSPKQALEIWHDMAGSLSSIVDVYWGPVVDVHDEKCPIIGAMDRSFSCSSDFIFDLCQSFIQVFHHHGIQVCAKHFPGHGKTQKDSHLDCASDERSLKDIEKELKPYQLPWDWIMSAHVSYPNAYGALPATFEPKALAWLKKNAPSSKLITDCLAMSALEHFDLKNKSPIECMKARLIQAKQAGHDHIMITHQNPEHLLSILDGITAGKNSLQPTSIQVNTQVMD